MAAIKGNEIIQDNHLANAIAQAEKYLELMREMNAQQKKLAAQQKKAQSTGGGGSVARNIKQTNQELSKAQKLYKTQQQITTKLAASERALIDVYKKENKQIIANRQAVSERNKEVKREIQLNKSAEGSIVQMRAKLSQMTATYDKLSKVQRENSNIGGKQAIAIKSLRDEIFKLESATGRSQRNVGNYSAALKGAALQARNLASALGAVGGVMMIANVVRDAFGVIKDFDAAQANLAAITGQTTDQLAGLTQQAKDLGSVTKFTASQVSGLQLELAKLGFTNQEISDATPAVLDFAAALGADLAQAAALAGSSVRAFGLSTEDTGRVTNVLTAAANKSALSFEFLQSAMSTIAPVANSFGFSIEETTALLGTLANSGFDASSAATATRNIMLNMADSSGKLAQALGGPVKTLPELVAGLNKLKSEGIDLAEALELTDKRSVAAFSTFLENADAAQQLSQDITGTNAASEAAAKQMDSLQGSLDLLRSAWEGYILGTDDATGASQGLKDVIKQLADNLPIILDTIINLVKAFVAFKIVKTTITLFRGLNKATITAKFSMKGLNATMKANPIGLVILAVEALIAIWQIFGDEIMETIEIFLEMFESLEKFERAMIELATIINPLAGAIIKMAAGIDQTSEAQSRANRVNQEALKQGQKILNQNKQEINDMQTLLTALESDNNTREEKNAIIEKLNTMYPELLENIDLEKAGAEELIAVQRMLTAEILKQSIEREKAAAKEKIFSMAIKKSIDAQITGNDALQREAEEYLESLTMIDEMAAKVYENLNGVVEGLDFGSNIREIDAAIDDLEGRLQVALSGKGGQGSAADIQARLDKLYEERRALLGLTFQTEAEIADVKKTEGGKGEDKRNKEIEDLRKKHQLELIKIENEGIEAGDAQEMIVQDQNKRRREQMIEELALIKELYGEGSKEAIEAQTRLQNEWLKQNEEVQKKRTEIHKVESEKVKKQEQSMWGFMGKVAQDELKKEYEARKKQQEEVRKLLEDQLKFFQDLTKQAIKNIDDQIKKIQDQIGEGDKRIEQLKELAAQGNLEASESIKAEEAKNAALQQDIKDLERKKNNLLIINTLLLAAQQGLEAGDSNAFGNANKQVSGLIGNAKKYKEGTEDTGKGGDIDSDGGFMAILHPNERVLTKDQNRALLGKGMSNDDVVAGAIAWNDYLSTTKTESFGNFKSIMALNKIAQKQEELIDAVKNIPATRSEFDPLHKAFKEIQTKGAHKSSYTKYIRY